MFDGLCHTGTWGSIGNMSVWGWLGLVLNLVFWIGLIAGFIVLAVRAMRRVPASTGTHATSQPTAKEILQSQYARGEITREQYELKKQDIA